MTSVKVAVRVRPCNAKEIESGHFPVISTDGKNLQLHKTKYETPEHRKTFTFDHCFGLSNAATSCVSQEEVFQTVGKPVVEHSLNGFNACILAYGQTGSGKTYTMLGSEESPGLIPRICQGLFLKLQEFDASRYKFKAEATFMEIYNEKVRDLLGETRAPLRVREHPKLGPYVEGLTLSRIHSYKDIEDLLERGNRKRSTAATNMNDSSSRSHAIFTLHLKQIQFDEETNQPRELYSKIHLVDLAGSERAAAAGSTGDRLKEGGHINKSLSSLGLVIHALSSPSDDRPSLPFVPYRDSVLTWLLKDSLGGNSHTVMVATVSPASGNYSETLSTLRYASRAMSIVNKPVVNEDPQTKLIRQLREEIARLNALLASRGDGSQSSLFHQLEETQAKEQMLTEMVQHRWEDLQKIFIQQNDLKISTTRLGSGVVLDSQQPHLVCLESQDPACSGIVLYSLKMGPTQLGRGSPDIIPDILVIGDDIEPVHCCLTRTEDQVLLEPFSTCFVDGERVAEKIYLSPGSIITLGQTAVFRFSDPRTRTLPQKAKKSLASLNLSPIQKCSTPRSEEDNLIGLTGEIREAVQLLRNLTTENHLVSTPTSLSFSDSESGFTPRIYSSKSGIKSRSCSAWNLSFPNSEYSEESPSCTTPSSMPLSRSYSVDSSAFSLMTPAGTKGTIQIAVTDYALNGSGRWSHYEYQVKITTPGKGHYNVWRRYSRFRDLHSYLSKKYGEPVSDLYFPPRKWFGNNSEKIAKERRHHLEAYLRRLVEVCTELPSCPLYTSQSKQALMNLAPFFRQGIFESSMSYQI